MTPTSTFILHTMSTAVLVILAIGLYYRHRNRTRHWQLMGTAFVIDVALVVYIEVSRGAIETVVGEVAPFVWFHAGISLAVIVLYLIMIRLGYGLLHGNEAFRPIHRRCAVVFLVFRGINYVTSFWV